MARRPLKRLAIFCAALGGVLAVALGMLVWSTRAELAEQRRLRHQMVAERVIDEVERELSLLLLREQRRPPYSSVAHTEPASWAPFVVGYFSLDDHAEAAPLRLAPRLLAGEQLDRERRQRIRWAIERWQDGEGASALPAALASDPRQGSLASPPALSDDPEDGALEKGAAIPKRRADDLDQNKVGERREVVEPPARVTGAPPRTAAPKKKSRSASSPQVLRRLNRGQEQRPREAPPPAGKQRDPMRDYELEFGL